MNSVIKVGMFHFFPISTAFLIATAGSDGVEYQWKASVDDFIASHMYMYACDYIANVKKLN